MQFVVVARYLRQTRCLPCAASSECRSSAVRVAAGSSRSLPASRSRRLSRRSSRTCKVRRRSSTGLSFRLGHGHRRCSRVCCEPEDVRLCWPLTRRAWVGACPDSAHASGRRESERGLVYRRSAGGSARLPGRDCLARPVDGRFGLTIRPVPRTRSGRDYRFEFPLRPLRRETRLIA